MLKMALFTKKTEKVSFNVSKKIVPIFETILSHNGDDKIDLLKQWAGCKTESCTCNHNDTDSAIVELDISDFDNSTKGLIYYYNEHQSGWYECMVKEYCALTLKEWCSYFDLSDNVQKANVSGTLTKKAPVEQRQFYEFLMEYENLSAPQMYARKYAMDIEKILGINIYDIKDVNTAQNFLNKFKPGGEYDTINKESHGGFRATLQKYVKYLEYLNENPDVENTKPQDVTVKISNKKLALSKCAELGYKVMPNVHFGSLNISVDVYWFNIKPAEFNQGVTLLCNDTKTGQVHVLNIPAGAVDPKVFRIRADNNLTNIEILYNDPDYKDRETGFSFKQYYQGTFSLPK